MFLHMIVLKSNYFLQERPVYLQQSFSARTKFAWLIMLYFDLSQVYRTGTLAQVTEPGGESKDVAIVQYFQDRGAATVLNFRSRKKQVVSHFISIISLFDWFTQYSFIDVNLSLTFKSNCETGSLIR